MAVIHALRASAPKVAAPMDMSVIITGAAESQALNCDYRDKDKPTNVLSFPALEPDELDDAFRFALAGGPPAMLGDMVICVPVVREEAQAQNKPADHHLAHLCVHGVLHLMGYDHIEDTEAEEMEALEREILAGMGIPDPYRTPMNMDEDDD
ncbi:rRNA maturation RNase YbeY [Kordiimonas aestuarii]|uniref:rRNA maturation RNase YbeY n=1 Tax=Kordiimonas aestuarii TaxID=1005925 RepID=UPI00374CA061